MSAYGQPFITPIKRNGHGWLSRGIADRCERSKPAGAPPSLEGIFGGGIESSKHNRCFTQSRRQVNIIVAKEAGNLPGNLLHRLDSQKIIRTGICLLYTSDAAD